MLFSPAPFSSCFFSSLLSLCPLFLLYGSLPLLWSLSLSLYCVCSVFFFCVTCVCSFPPLVSWFSLCFFYRPLFYVCFLLPDLCFSFSLCSSPLFLEISSVCVFPQRFLFCPLGSIPHRLWLFSSLYKAIECHALVRQMKWTHKTVTLMMETHRRARSGFSSSSLVC